MVIICRRGKKLRLRWSMWETLGVVCKVVFINLSILGLVCMFFQSMSLTMMH